MSTMPPFALKKVAALCALLLCSARPSQPETETITKVAAAKTATLQCRRYFGCAPRPQVQGDKVIPFSE
jgi:hypothetical protein